jgi:hypothetical protein
MLVPSEFLLVKSVSSNLLLVLVQYLSANASFVFTNLSFVLLFSMKLLFASCLEYMNQDVGIILLFWNALLTELDDGKKGEADDRYNIIATSMLNA